MVRDHIQPHTTMADLKRLEDAKLSLQTAQTKIKLVLNDAKENLNRQNAILARAKSEILAARVTLSKLKALAESHSLCSRCWELFPALNGNNCLWANNDENCLNCGLSLSQTYELPPTNTDAINIADTACKAAETAIKGKVQSPKGVNSPSVFGYKSNSFLMAGQTSTAGYNYRMQPSSNSVCRQKMLTEEHKRAEEHCRKVKNQLIVAQSIIYQWTQYYDQHKKQYKKVKQALVDIEEQERKILESKLNKLSGGKRKKAAGGNSFSECAICMEREKEIVFQCGHQCCSVCAPKISQCHTCRAFIKQKIKLHG